MGSDRKSKLDKHKKRSHRRRKKTSSSEDTDGSPSSSSSTGYSSSDLSDSIKRKRKRSGRHRGDSRHRSRHRRSSAKGEDANGDRSMRKRNPRLRGGNGGSKYSYNSSEEEVEEEEALEPEALVSLILQRFPEVANDLRQLLQMIDNGQAADVTGISNKSLVKLLKRLFLSLKLVQHKHGIFLLPSIGRPTLEVVGSTLCSHIQPASDPDAALLSKSQDDRKSSAPATRKLIGPEMPSRELLAAAAELAEAETLLREADLEVDNDFFIGPPPPAVVAEAESANEAERFEEVARIAGAEVDKPYDVLGANWKMALDNIKKRYWKLSLMVHPDKCSHPLAHQAFVVLNQAFKILQDPDKKKAIDEKIKLKEEEQAMKVELQSLREAAKWRKSQGISIEGDEELLALVQEPEEAPKRDDWMTTLPPERKPGVTMQSTSFSRTTKEGRGDTSIWTDNPLDKAEKAKQNYLEAFNKAKALANMDDEKKKSSDANLVDQYNSSKRSKTLVQKHQEESKHHKKKSRQSEKEEWAGQHPWKPWDREKDLTAGRTKVNLDSENMGKGLSSRFSSGPMQRNFL